MKGFNNDPKSGPRVWTRRSFFEQIPLGIYGAALTQLLGRDLFGQSTRAEAFWRRFSGRMTSAAAPSPERPSGLLLALYGSFVAGGARDTRWHDVLTAAGLADAASDRVGWPTWTPIDVLARHPEYIVTETGMGALLCAREGIATTPACLRGHVLEVDADLLSDPGPTMLDAAEALADLVEASSATP